MTNMPKLADNNTSATSKNVTPLPLQLPLNTFNTPIHCSIERFAATTQINSTIYHSFWSCQPLVAPQNMSPTRLGNTPVWEFKYSMRVMNMIWIWIWYEYEYESDIWYMIYDEYDDYDIWYMIYDIHDLHGIFNFSKRGIV